MRLWNLSDLTVVRDLAAHRQRVRAICFSPDGSRLATGGDDRRLRIWNVNSGEEVISLPNRSGKIQALVFCGNNNLASGTSDNSICVWDLAVPSVALRLVGHTGSVSSLDYLEGTSPLVSGSFDTSARIWILALEARPKIARQPGDGAAAAEPERK